MKRRVFGILLIMAICFGMFPMKASAVEDGGVVYVKRIAYTGTAESPCYLITDENGNVSSEGADESNYNIKWDGANLILRNAYVVGDEVTIGEDIDDDQGDAISADCDLTVTLIGENKLIGISEDSAGLSVYENDNLCINGEGSLYAEGDYCGIYSRFGELTVNGGDIVAVGVGEGNGISCYGTMNMVGGHLTLNGKKGFEGGDVLNMTGGTLYATGEAGCGIYCEVVTMTGGEMSISSDSYGIGMLENASLTGGTLDIQAGKVGMVVKGDYNLTVGGDAEVNIESSQIGINIWTEDDTFSNCNFIFNSGTLNVCGNEQTISTDGNIYVAPTDGIKAIVNTGDTAESLTMLEGAPYTEETILTDLIGESKYVSMSTTGEPIGLPYTDVQADDWFYDAVAFASKSGLMTGTSATTFEPSTSFSRAMLVSVLHRLEGSPAMEGSVFSDVNDGDWYAEAVNWAAANGIVNGMDDGSFQPNAAITREQMAAILCNYAQYKGIPTESSGDLSGYSDADQVSAWAEGSVIWAVDMGLIHGMSMNTLEPQGTATRAQAATVLMNAGTLLGA